MYNHEILQSLLTKFGTDKVVEVCNIISTLYEIKYNACKTRECLEEYDYEREWWSKAAAQLEDIQPGNI